MLDRLRQRRATKRLQPGDGRPLGRYRWWHMIGRALFHLRLFDADGTAIAYAVDVRHWQNQGSGEVRADLFRDGRHHAASRIPARFPVEGGTIEVAMSGFGMKRCHYVGDDGTERQLVPDRRTAEGRRARLQQRHPALSRALATGSVLMLLVGVALLLVQVAEPVSRIPPIADNLGVFTSPVTLPLWLNIALGVGAFLGGLERSLRLRYHWLLDGAGS